MLLMLNVVLIDPTFVAECWGLHPHGPGRYWCLPPTWGKWPPHGKATLPATAWYKNQGFDMFNDVSTLPKYIDRSYYIMKIHEISNLIKQFESNIYLGPSETEKF